MRIVAKNLQYKNLTAALSAIRRNGRYTSMIQIVAENYQDEHNATTETPAANDFKFRPATDSSANKTQPLNLLPVKVSVSNLKSRPISWPLPIAKEKFPLHLLNKSLSTSSIAWSKKSCSDVSGARHFDPNYDYPYLSKIFGTENLLMKSDAYNQALIEAARRRADLQKCKTARKEEMTSGEFKRPQVVSIKGWGASTTNIKPALESKLQAVSNASPSAKKNVKQTDKILTKSDAWQSTGLWNADKSDNPCPPPVKSPKQAKLNSKSNEKSSTVPKPSETAGKVCEAGKTINLSNMAKAGVDHELKRKSHSSNQCAAPGELKKQADGSCKKNDPCKPSDPCKKELEKLEKRKEEEQKKHRNQIPTGCVDPKCNQTDKCNQTPKNTEKKATARKRPQRRTFAGVKRLRGCIGKGDEKPICADSKHEDVQKIINFDRKKRPYSATENLGPKNVSCGKSDSLQNKHICGSGSIKKTDDPCDRKKPDPCKDKNLNPCGDSKKESPKSDPCGTKKIEPSQDKQPSPCGDSKKESPKSDPCGSKKSDPSQDKKPSPCGDSKKDSTKTDPCGSKKIEPSQDKQPSPCGDSKKESPKSDPCGSKKIEPSQDKKPSPCGDSKKDSTKTDPCGSKKIEPCQDKKISPCSDNKKESPKDPCGTSLNKETPEKKKDTCGGNKQTEDPCKKKEPSASNKRNEKTNDCNEKGPCQNKKPSAIRNVDPDRIPCRTCNSVEKKEPKDSKSFPKSDCSVGKTSSKSCGSLTEDLRKEPDKECKSPHLLKNILKRDCGRIIKYDFNCKKLSSQSCDSIKTQQRTPDPCKASSTAAKKETTSSNKSMTSTTDCSMQKKSTNPNCINAKEPLSNCGTFGKEQKSDPCKSVPAAELKKPTSPSLTNISVKRDCGKPITRSKSDCGNLNKSVSSSDSLKENKKGDPCKTKTKTPASTNVKKPAADVDCEKPKRDTKPNCSKINKSPSTSDSAQGKAIKYPCKSIPSAGTVQNPNQKLSKVAGNLDFGKQKRETKPNCRKSFSTLTINANESLNNMISRTLATLPSIKQNMFMRNFSSKSKDKKKKDKGDIGKKSQCKTVGTTVPAQRKPTFSPHPNDSLRQCYPTYDLDCKKFCKNSRKTDCKKQPSLEKTNTNKRKGKK